MKDISGNLKEIINQEVLNLVRCWKITLENGNTLCFTTSNEDFVYQNEKYNSISAYEISNLNANIDINDDSAEISNLIVNDLIKDSDILSGLYNNAKVEIFIINKDNLDAGKVSLLNGNIADIEYKDNVFIAKVSGLKTQLNKTIGDVYSPLCRCGFCSDKCKLNKNNFTFSGIVSSVINNVNFETNTTTITQKSRGYFDYGIIEFTSGKNIGQKTEVKQFQYNSIILASELTYKIEVGDNFNITAGCDKQFSTCCNKFNNAINFRGEPHLPGTDILLKIM